MQAPSNSPFASGRSQYINLNERLDEKRNSGQSLPANQQEEHIIVIAKEQFAQRESSLSLRSFSEKEDDHIALEISDEIRLLHPRRNIALLRANPELLGSLRYRCVPKKPEANLLMLPNDILSHLALFLDEKGARSLGLTSRHCRSSPGVQTVLLASYFTTKRDVVRKNLTKYKQSMAGVARRNLNYKRVQFLVGVVFMLAISWFLYSRSQAGRYPN